MNKREIEQALKDYHWMINVIAEHRKDDYIIGGNLVAQGGIESALPKGKGTTSDPVAVEVLRRDEDSQWIKKLEKRVTYIQMRIPLITDLREQTVLNMVLNGAGISEISRCMRLSRSHIYNIQQNIIGQFAQSKDICMS